MTNNKKPVSANIIFPLWLVFVWCVLWHSMSSLTVLGGIVVATIVMSMFKLPAAGLSGRVNPYYVLTFFFWFIKELFKASFFVAAAALKRGKNIKSSVFAVPVRPTSTFITTIVSHIVTLVPGSSIVDVDYTDNVMYLHAIDVENQVGIDHHTKDTLDIQARVIRAIGSKAEYEMLKEEERA